jgi:hypothetical protein
MNLFLLFITINNNFIFIAYRSDPLQKKKIIDFVDDSATLCVGSVVKRH